MGSRRRSDRRVIGVGIQESGVRDVESLFPTHNSQLPTPAPPTAATHSRASESQLRHPRRSSRRHRRESRSARPARIAVSRSARPRSARRTDRGACGLCMAVPKGCLGQYHCRIACKTDFATPLRHIVRISRPEDGWNRWWSNPGTTPEQPVEYISTTVREFFHRCVPPLLYHYFTLISTPCSEQIQSTWSVTLLRASQRGLCFWNRCGRQRAGRVGLVWPSIR
jgi:hypothetical protein